MRLFKRLNATIQSNFNAFLDQIENHEALVTEAMHEVKTAAAQAGARLARLQQDEDKLAARLNELRKEITQWKERAVQAGTADEARALECVRRMARATSEEASTEAQLNNARELRARLVEDLRGIQGKLDELQRKKHALATRQFRAEAMKAIQSDGASALDEITGIFDRWETRVTEAEGYVAGPALLTDGFEQAYRHKEDQEALRTTLQALLAESKTSA
ncbi:PspA/IM30 family protein [Nitrospira moscoviensis]|uniref:Putative PspA/IM30 family protein n=1 Tax=Nitrospira moscoviensis TaxID=42253 RepID=A0A0K2GD87_NITMO|nr:PspA/IM30 family protein [Nitrospira moscoviensis]ALA58839.1 putative PspA/IM30 family protein [Nitrospira moscoviensis]